MTERWITGYDGIEYLIIESFNDAFEMCPANDYPAQAYVWKHNPRIRRAELAWRRKHKDESEQPGSTA